MSAARAKGTAFETAVVNYLKAAGLANVTRTAQAGKLDRGDIAGVPGWTLELKNTKQLDLPGAVDEARRERDNTNTPWFAAIIKRRRKGVGEAYVVLPLWEFVDLVTSHL